MNDIWFFGDSFCSADKNWVSHLKEVYGYNSIRNLGSAGTSLQYLIFDLLEKKHKINKTDGVVICLTDFARSTFKNKHFMPTILDSREHQISISSPTSLEIESYKMYVNNLITVDHSAKFHHSFVFNQELHLKFIFDDILPSLSTNKIGIISSFSETHDLILKSNIIKNKKLYRGSISFLDIFMRTLNERTYLKFEEEFETPNHFIYGDKKYYMELIMSSFKNNFSNL